MRPPPDRDKAFYKVIFVIGSCTNLIQLSSARNMVENFRKMYHLDLVHPDYEDLRDVFNVKQTLLFEIT